MSELAPIPEDDVRTLVVPGTGELLRMGTADEAAAAFDRLSELQGELALVKRYVTDRLTELAKLYGKQTMPLSDGRKVTLSSGTTTTYDADAIYADLIDAGMPEERIREIVEETVTYRVKAAQAKQAAAANPAYAEIIERHKTVTEKPRYASIGK